MTETQLCYFIAYLGGVNVLIDKRVPVSNKTAAD